MEALFCCLFVIIPILLLTRKHLNSKKHKNLPPSPPGLPILGHLHLLKSSPHRSLQALSEKYGPVVYLRYGVRPVLLVSSPSAVDQCFTKNDIIFANRPEALASKILGYDYSTVGYAPYGAHWRNLRRLLNVHVFSNVSLHRSSIVHGDETRFLLKRLFEGCDDDNPMAWKKVDLRSLFFELVYNVALVIISGKRGDVMDEMFGPRKIMDICDYVPFLKWIGFKGMEKELVDVHQSRDGFLQGLVDEARNELLISGKNSVEEKKKTYIQTLLSLQQAEPEYFTDEILKGLVMPIFTAGTHSTAVTMEWAMSLLLNHPDELQKLRNEIDDKVGSGRFIEDSDLKNVPSLYCLINETLRLRPSGPLLVPRSASEDCKVEGWDVPKGTTLLVNAWAIHRDPNLWDEPSVFNPERFKGHEFGFDGYKFIPFGMGRRACPGSGMAMRLMGLALGLFIQCFEWQREGHDLVDMEEVTGLTLSKLRPLEALYRPRSSMLTLLSQL